MAKLKSKSRHKATMSLSHIEYTPRHVHGRALSTTPTETSPSSSAGAGGSPILTRATIAGKGKRSLDTPATGTFSIDDGYHSSATDTAASAGIGSVHRPAADLRRHKRARIGGSRPDSEGNDDWIDLVKSTNFKPSYDAEASLADRPKLNETEEEMLKHAALADLHLQSPLTAGTATYEDGATPTVTHKEAPRQLQLVQKIRLEARSDPSTSHHRTQSSVNLQTLHAHPDISAHQTAHMHLRALILPDRVRANGGTLIDAETLLLLSRGRSQSDSLVRSQKLARSQRGHGRTMSMPEGMLLGLRGGNKSRPNYQTTVEEASEDELQEHTQDEVDETDWLDESDDTKAEAQDDDEEESQADEVSDWETVCSDLPHKARKPSLSRRKQWRKTASGSMRSRRPTPETATIDERRLGAENDNNAMYGDEFLAEMMDEHDIAPHTASTGLGGSFRPLGWGGSVSEPVRLTFSLARIHAPITTVQGEPQDSLLDEDCKNDNERDDDEEIVIEAWIVDDTPSILHEHEHEQPFFHDFDGYPGAFQDADDAKPEHELLFEEEGEHPNHQVHEHILAAPTCLGDHRGDAVHNEASEHWYDDDEMWGSSETEDGRFEGLGEMAKDMQFEQTDAEDVGEDEDGWEDATDDGNNEDDEDAQMEGQAACLAIYATGEDAVRSGRTYPSRADMVKLAMLIDTGVIDEASAMHMLEHYDGFVGLPSHLAQMQLGPASQGVLHVDSDGPVDPYALLDMYGDAFPEDQDGEGVYDGAFEYYGEEDYYDGLGSDAFPPGHIVSPFAGLVKQVMPYSEDVYYGLSITMEGSTSTNDRYAGQAEDALVEEDEEAAIPRSVQACPSTMSRSTWRTVFEHETLAELEGRIYRAERGLRDDGHGGVISHSLHGCRPRSARDRRLGCWKRLKEVV